MNFLKRKIRLWILDIVFGKKLKELCIEKRRNGDGYIVEFIDNNRIEAFLLTKEHYCKLEVVPLLRKV